MMHIRNVDLEYLYLRLDQAEKALQINLDHTTTAVIGNDDKIKNEAGGETRKKNTWIDQEVAPRRSHLH